MVKKLLKHEISAYLRVMLPAFIILLGIALMGRAIQFFEYDSSIYGLVFGSAILVFIIAIIACFALSSVFGIIRFYKNLFTGEGYLTFALPVTVSQHIIVKVATAILSQFATVVAAVIAICIITFGEVTVEIFKAAGYILSLEPMHAAFYVLEAIILLVIADFAGFMLFYLCISIGQMFNKNRIFAAVGIYFAFYLAGQVLTTIVSIFFALFYNFLPLVELGELIAKYPFESVHVILWIEIFLYIIFGGIYFIVTRQILTKRLNLE